MKLKQVQAVLLKQFLKEQLTANQRNHFGLTVHIKFFCNVNSLHSLFCTGMSEIEKRRYSRRLSELSGATATTPAMFTPSQSVSDNSTASDPPSYKSATGTQLSAPPAHLTQTGNQSADDVSMADSPLDCVTHSSRSQYCIRYHVLQQMYSAQVQEVTHLTSKNTLDDLIKAICTKERLSRALTVELFSAEGYPLSPNKTTVKRKCLDTGRFYERWNRFVTVREDSLICSLEHRPHLFLLQRRWCPKLFLRTVLVSLFLVVFVHIVESLEDWQLSSGCFVPVVVRKRGELDVEEDALTLPKLDPNVGEWIKQCDNLMDVLTEKWVAERVSPSLSLLFLFRIWFCCRHPALLPPFSSSLPLLLSLVQLQSKMKSPELSSEENWAATPSDYPWADFCSRFKPIGNPMLPTDFL